MHQSVQCRRQLIHRGIAPALQLQFETTRTAESGYNRGRREIHTAFRIFGHVLLHLSHDAAHSLAGAFAPRLEDHSQFASALAAAHTGAAACHTLNIFHSRIVHQIPHGTLRHHSRALKCRTLGHLQLHLEISLILYREEARRHEAVDNEDSYEHEAESSQNPAVVADGFTHYPYISVIARCQPPVNAAKHGILLSVLILRPQQLGTHYRAEGQGHNRRQQHRYNDRDSELPVEQSCDARQEAYGEESCGQHERCSDDGTRQALHGLFCCLIGSESLLAHHTLDILDNDNSIVDHNAYRKHKSEQRQHIERESEKQHETERAYQRYRHGHERYQRGTPALQGEKHNEDNQHQSLEQRVIDSVDRLGDIGRHVERYVIAHAIREVGTDLVHSFLDALSNLHGISTRKHIYSQNGRILSVDRAFGVVALSLQRHPRHIAQPDQRSVGTRPYDYLFKFAHRRQTSSRGYRHRYIKPLHRLLSEHTGRRLPVLILESFLDIGHGQSEIRKFVGFKPYLHGIVAAADIRHTSYTGNAAQRVEYIQRCEITQVDLVELRIVGCQADGQKLARRLFFHRYTVLHHFRRQTRFRQLDAVLHLDGCQIGTRRDIKRYGCRKRPGIGT